MPGIIKKWLYSALFLAIIVLLLAGFFPFLVEKFVLPPVLDRVGLSGYEFSVSRLGLNGCSLHIVGRPRFPSPIVSGNVRMDWTPSGLLQRRVARVSSKGLQINLVDLPAKSVSTKIKPEHEESPGGKTNLPIVIDQLEVSNGSLVLPLGNRIVYLPFTFSGHRIGDQELIDSSGGINFRFRLQVAEQVVTASIRIDQLEGKLSAQLDSNLDLAALVKVSPDVLPASIELGGDGQLEIEAVAQMAPFYLESVEAEIIVDNLMATGNDFSVKTLESQPARISVSGSGTQLQVTGKSFHLARPFSSSIGFTTHISPLNNRLQWKGFVDLEPEAGSVISDSIVLKEFGPVRINHEGSHFDGKSTVRLTDGQPEGSPKGSLFIVEQNDISVVLEGYNLDGLITFEHHTQLNTLVGTLSAKGSNLLVKAPQGVFKVPQSAILAQGTVALGQPVPDFAARINMDGASFESESQNLQVQGMQLELPIAWPITGDFEKGSFQINTINLDGKDLGNFSAEIAQNFNSLKINGSLQTPLFPEEEIKVSGSVRLPEQLESIAELAFSLANASVVTDNFTAVLPAVQGMSGTGNLNVQGNLAISPCGLDGQAVIALNNGRLSIRETGTELEGISFSLNFPAFPSLGTDPKQQLSIGEISKGKLLVNDVKALFEIESPSSLFIEKISGHWSRGRVFTSSFRLQKDQDELDLAIFCDRLELSSILSQFSLAEAGGEGRLSGRVPVVYTQGRFYVDDGFLFSTPGEKGYLKIKQSKYLETTIPAGVPQFSPLHFAGAALADFEYNWAKLQIKSEEENLLLKLQVDGKPKDKLPFRFDTKNNVFVRLDDESKGGIDQPIKLDVNFNVPVNEIFQYKDNLMPLFRKLN